MLAVVLDEAMWVMPAVKYAVVTHGFESNCRQIKVGADYRSALQTMHLVSSEEYLTSSEVGFSRLSWKDNVQMCIIKFNPSGIVQNVKLTKPF